MHNRCWCFFISFSMLTEVERFFVQVVYECTARRYIWNHGYSLYLYTFFFVNGSLYLSMYLLLHYNYADRLLQSNKPIYSASLNFNYSYPMSMCCISGRFLEAKCASDSCYQWSPQTLDHNH